MKSNILINGKEIQKNHYMKPALNIQQQIDLLKSRWLTFWDEQSAIEQLSKNSYYRLSGYARLFYKDKDHNFVVWTSFKQITELYYFDWDLKLLLLEALETIEIAFKTTIINILSVEYWAHRFMDKKHFASDASHKFTLGIIETIITKNKENIFIKHYTQKYSTPKYPPSWMIFQLSPFGDTGNIYKSLTQANKAKLSSKYGLHRSNLESRVDCLSYLRNLCAHSDRVWNRTMTKKVNIKWFEQFFSKDEDGMPVIDTLFAYLIVITYFMNYILHNTQWLEKFKKLLKTHNKVDIKRMWFPDNWEEVITIFLKEIEKPIEKKNT